MMRHRWINCSVIVLLFSLLILATRALLAAPQKPAATWQMIGQIGGPTQAVAVQGHYAYVGVGLRLVVLDVTIPTTPTEVGSTTPFPYFVEDVVVSGTLAYVAAGGAGLRVVSILTPTAPVEVGYWDSPAYAEGLTVAGSTVYLADGPYGLWTVDVSDPAHPRKVGAAYDMNYAFEVAVSGGHAYIAAAGAGLLVADVSDPAHPVEVGTLDTPGYAYGIAVSGTLAYVADAWEGLQVVDVTNPLSPTVIGVCDTPGWALNVAVAGSTAYVADGAFGLRIVDVSDPAHPHEVGAYEADGLARRVVVAGSTAYIADQRGGLRTVDVAAPSHPVQVSLYSPMTGARRVAVAGSYAYVAAEFLGLRVVDVSDPAHPREVGAYDTEGAYTADVVVSGTYAYLATFMYGPYNLHVLDISDPAHPTRVSTIPVSNNQEYKDLALVGDILYVVYGWGLQLIDVSNPTAPAKLGSFEPLQSTQNVTISGTLAYVADDGYGVKIVDVSNPYSPTLVSTYDYQWANDVAVVGDKLYLAGHGFGLRVLDISDLENPFEIGFYDTPGIADGVTISGTEIYVSDEGGGVVVVDVSNPFTPVLLTAYDTAGGAWHTTLVGNYAYVADRHGGLVILERTAGASASGLEEPSSSASSSPPALETITERHRPRRHAGTVADPVSNRVSAADAARVRDAGVPAMASTCVVTSTADSGAGTLRRCLENATSGTTVTFDPLVFPPTSPVTIALSSELPPIAQGYVTIDGSNAGVILDGSSTPPGANGLLLMSDGNTVKGLQVLYFPASGVVIGNARYNRVGGDRTKGSGPLGEGNLISGNYIGIHIGGRDAPVISNTVSGNLIGTDPSGTTAIGNRDGIMLAGWASYNLIGGTTAGERNIISGNLIGIEIIQKGVNGNTIAGNYIGTDVSGMRPLANDEYGIVLWDGPCGNILGGTTPGEGNLISGNPTGVMIAGIDANHNAVIGNWIGTDATGTQALGNSWGIHLCAYFSRVEGNVISGNAGKAIDVCDGTPYGLILGNYIGTDASGSQPLGNAVGIGLSGLHTLVGGTTAPERNVVGGNQWGIDVGRAGTEYNWIAGNAIGTDASATIPLGNDEVGVGMRDYVAHTSLQGNTIAFNHGEWGNVGGVYVEHSPYNTIRRNSIYSNIGAGIALGEGGNNLLSAPVIITATLTRISGTTCSGCTVEVFSDVEDEGRVYEGSAISDTSGVFTFTKTSGLNGPFVTATATDRDGNTSEFSPAQRVWRWVYLPMVLRGQ